MPVSGSFSGKYSDAVNPFHTPHIRTPGIRAPIHAAGQAKPIPLPRDERLARPVGDLLHGNRAIAEENSVVGTAQHVRYPFASAGTAGAGTINKSSGPNVVRHRGLKIVRPTVGGGIRKMPLVVSIVVCAVRQPFPVDPTASAPASNRTGNGKPPMASAAMVCRYPFCSRSTRFRGPVLFGSMGSR